MELTPFVWLFLVEDQCVLLQMFANEQTSRICGPCLRSTEICPIIWPVSFVQILRSPHQVCSPDFSRV